MCTVGVCMCVGLYVSTVVIEGTSLREEGVCMCGLYAGVHVL